MHRNIPRPTQHGAPSPPRLSKRQHPPRETVCTGEKATFFLKVLFRQNAGWQGSVTWLEGGQEQSFRSVLELLGLLDSALSETEKAS